MINRPLPPPIQLHKPQPRILRLSSSRNYSLSRVDFAPCHFADISIGCGDEADKVEVGVELGRALASLGSLAVDLGEEGAGGEDFSAFFGCFV